MSDRLSKSDWLAHGLKALAEAGPGALNIGALAAGLNVSRGSFYWHFRDVADYRDQLLESWLERATDQIIRRLEDVEVGKDRLPSLMRGAFVTRPALSPTASPWAAEKAIRAWGAGDARVGAIVASVDAKRVAYIARLLTDLGVGSDVAASRAAFLYWAYLGQELVLDSGLASTTEAAINDIAALFARTEPKRRGGRRA